MNLRLDPWDESSTTTPSSQPGVVLWFKIFCGFMLALYLMVAGLGTLMLMMPELLVDPEAGIASNQPADTTEAAIMGGVYLALGGILAVLYVLPFFLPRRKGTWVYNLVMICLSMTSFCCLPAAIPLLIFWIKQETRDWYIG